MDKFWHEIGCKCPIMDNEDNYPHRSFISQDCYLHAPKKCEKCGTTENVTYWVFDPDCGPSYYDDNGAYYCSKCGYKPYITVYKVIIAGLILFGLVQLFTG